MVGVSERRNFPAVYRHSSFPSPAQSARHFIRVRMSRLFRAALRTKSLTNIRKSTSLPHVTFIRLFAVITLCTFSIFFLILPQNRIFRDLLTTTRRLYHPLHLGNPLVSVVVTTYNVQRYINQTLQAVLSQSYSNLQIIIVDDGSSDSTMQYVSAFESNDYRIETVRIATHTLGGAGTAANIGIQRAIGKYVAVLDGDDLPRTSFISKLVAAAESSNADIACAQIALYGSDISNSTVIERDRVFWPDAKTAARSRESSFGINRSPHTLFLAPASSRKLYKTAFLSHHRLSFAEADCSFEDLEFHWALHAHSARAAFVSEPLLDHRIETGSPSVHVFRGHIGAPLLDNLTRRYADIKKRLQENVDSMQAADVIKIVPNLNNAGRHILKCTMDFERCNLMRKAFLMMLSATTWVETLFTEYQHSDVIRKASSIYFRTMAKWQNVFGANSSLTSARILNHDILLSIVIPTHNIRDFLPSLETNLDKLTVKFEVIFVDDRSTDDTAEAILKITEARNNWHLLHTNGGRPGLARNLGQLFAEGKYVFFFDSDDYFNATHLSMAARFAQAEDLDVLMMSYAYQQVRLLKDKKINVAGTKEMPEKEAWRKAVSKDLMEKKLVAAISINYPWNKLVRTEMMMRENVFHAPTTLNEDVQHHWHAIMAAHSIDFLNSAVVVQHRQFRGRNTMTSVRDSRRMSLLDAVAMTNRVLERNGFMGNADVRKKWVQFSNELVKWGRARIPKEMESEYEQRSRDLMRILGKTGIQGLL